jgi:hypothetical protein
MRKLLASLPIVVTAVVLASQPAGAKSDPMSTVAEIGAALEAHGVTPCDSPDWTNKSYGDRDEPRRSAIAVMRTRGQDSSER